MYNGLHSADRNNRLHVALFQHNEPAILLFRDDIEYLAQLRDRCLFRGLSPDLCILEVLLFTLKPSILPPRHPSYGSEPPRRPLGADPSLTDGDDDR